MDTCADCGKPIGMTEPLYRRYLSGGTVCKSYHSACGDPFGIKAKDAENERLRAALRPFADALTAAEKYNPHPYSPSLLLIDARSGVTLYEFSKAREAVSAHGQDAPATSRPAHLPPGQADD